MPKIIELTVEINVQKVSCPGVWLCQDGRVSLSVYTLGTSYETCMMPPVFPLMYRDVFYFRKRFHETCALNNMCCLLKDETIYCELVQWCEDCVRNECLILAQYLGSLNDVLFPPNMCSNDGVDLLMRRTSEFPGILSPKIEICTKVRIDEVWDQNCSVPPPLKIKSCTCSKDIDGYRQKQVCHSAEYHRSKCNTLVRPQPVNKRSRSRVRSAEPGSCCSLKEPSEPNCYCPEPTLRQPSGKDIKLSSVISEPLQRTLLESRFIEETNGNVKSVTKPIKPRAAPCVCEICRRYHELFHT